MLIKCLEIVGLITSMGIAFVGLVVLGDFMETERYSFLQCIGKTLTVFSAKEILIGVTGLAGAVSILCLMCAFIVSL